MEIAVGYVRLVADFKEAEKAIKDMEKEFSKAHKDVQKSVDDTVKSLGKMEKAVKDTNKSSKSFLADFKGMFSDLVGIVTGFGSVFSTVFKTAGMIFKAFSAIIAAQAKIITGVFNAIIAAISGVLTTLGLLASAGGKALTALHSAFEKLIKITAEYLNILKDLAFSFVTLGKIAVGALRELSKFLDDLTKKFVFVQLDIRYIIDQMKTFATVLGGSIVGATAAAMSFEEAFVKIRRVVDASESEFALLSQRIRDMATETTSSANELAEMGFVAGQMGIEGVANIERFIDVMDKLTQVTNIVGLEGSAAFAKLMVVMNEPLDRIENLASAVVDLGRNFAVFEDEILHMSKVVAGSGAAIGLTVDQVLALSAAMSAAGVRAARGGTAMSKIILNMAQAAAKGDKTLTSFAEIAGVTTEQFKEMVKRSPERAIQMFIAGIGGIVERGENWADALDSVGLSTIRVRDVILRLVNAGELMNKTLDVSENAYEKATALATEFAVRVSTVWAQLQMLGSSLMEIVRVIGTPFLEVARKAIGILRVMAEVIRRMDPKQLKIIAGFLALGAALFTLVTAGLMAIKALFTLATGLTLLARLAAFILPILGIVTLLNEIFGDFTIDNLAKQFTNLKENVVAVYDYLKDLYRDTKKWFKESKTIEQWGNIVSDSFGEIADAWGRLKNDENYGSFEFTLDLAEISTTAVADMLVVLEEGLAELTSYAESADINVFNEKAMSQEMRDNKWVQIATNIAKILRTGFRIAFISLPKLMYTVLEASGMNAEAKRVGKLWWDGFKESVLSKVPGLFDDMTGRLEGFQGTIKTLEIPDQWAEKSIEDMKAKLESENIDPLWISIITSGITMGKALKGIFIESFGKLHEALQKAIDWDKFWNQTANKMAGGIDKMNAKLEKGLANIRAWDVTKELPETENPLIQSLLDVGSTIFQIYAEILMKGIHYALVNTPWAQIGRTLAETFMEGFGSVVGGWMEGNLAENVYTRELQSTGNKDTVPPSETLGKWWTGFKEGFDWLVEKEKSSRESVVQTKTQSTIEDLVRELAEKNKVDADLASAIALVESNYRDVNVINEKEQSYGPMQLHAGGGALQDITTDDYKPDLSTLEGRVEAGVRYAKWLVETQTGILDSMVEKHEEIENIFQAAIIAYRGIGYASDLNTISGIDLERLNVAKSYGLSSGGILEGFGGGDSIPAMLEPGEAVVPAKIVAGGIAAIESWFYKNGVRYQQGTVGDYNQTIPYTGAIFKPDSLLDEELLESISESSGNSVDFLEKIMNFTDFGFDNLVEVLDTLSVGLINKVDSFGRIMIKLISPLLDDETVTLLEEKFEGFVSFLETLRTFAEQYLPELAPYLGGGGKGGGDGDDEDIEAQQLSVMERFWLGFQQFQKSFDAVARVWDQLAPTLDEEAQERRDFILSLNKLFQAASPDSAIVEELSKTFEDLRTTGAEMFGSEIAGNMYAGVMAGMAAGSGGNIIGGIASGLGAAGLISPIWGAVASIIGSMVPHDTVSPEFTQLRDNTIAANKQLKEFGHTFRAVIPEVKDVSGFFTKLFGGKKLKYYKMEEAKRTLGEAQEILNKLNQIFNVITSNLANAFSAETFADFVDSFGQSLYQTARDSLITAFVESDAIEPLLKQLTTAFDLGIEYDEAGNPFLTPGAKAQIQAYFELITTRAKPFYEMLSELEIAGYGASDAINSMTASLKNVPEMFKINLERYRAIQGEPIPSAATGGIVSRTGLVNVHAGEVIGNSNSLFDRRAADNRGESSTIYKIEFSGPVLGEEHIKSVIAKILDEINTDNSRKTHGGGIYHLLGL